jgi:hypothetical protein
MARARLVTPRRQGHRSDTSAAEIVAAGSGDLAKIVAIVEDDPHPGAQRPGISAQGRDLVHVQVAVLDLADPPRRDPHQIGNLSLGKSQPFAFLGKVERADPGLGAATLRSKRVIVPVVQLGADVVPVVKLRRDPSLRFPSKANQPS